MDNCSGVHFAPRSHFLADSYYKRYLRHSANRPVGGKTSQGYVAVTVSANGTTYNMKGHYAVWRMFGREQPVGMELDHIDGIRHRNVIDNLRLLPHLDNAKNRSISRRNTSGVTGVSWDKYKGMWVAYVMAEGRLLQLGRSHNFEEAVEWRKEAEKVYYGEFVRAEEHR